MRVCVNVLLVAVDAVIVFRCKVDLPHSPQMPALNRHANTYAVNALTCTMTSLCR